MKRFASVWFPHWPVERLYRSQRHKEPADKDSALRDKALVLVASEQGKRVITAAGRLATEGGAAPGMTLRDARTLVPDLVAREATPETDIRALTHLGRWCGRYTPWTARCGSDGI